MRLSLKIELERGESGNLMDLLSGDEGTEKVARILRSMADAEIGQDGPVTKFGIGFGEQRLLIDYTIPVSEIE